MSLSLSLLHFPPSKFVFFFSVFYFWEQIERFLGKNGNRWQEVACKKIVWFVMVDTYSMRGQMARTLIFFKKMLWFENVLSGIYK